MGQPAMCKEVDLKMFVTINHFIIIIIVEITQIKLCNWQLDIIIVIEITLTINYNNNNDNIK